MNRKTSPDTDWLRTALRNGDPAFDGREPDAGEFLRMRRRMLSASDDVPAPIGVPARALAVAAVLALTVALGWGLWNDGVVDSRGVADPGATVIPATRDARQIQFSTPGGTRVVWTLDPDFEV